MLEFKDNQDEMMIFFKKSPIGTYEFYFPLLCEKMPKLSYRSEYSGPCYKVKGLNEGLYVNGFCMLDSDEILKSLEKKCTTNLKNKNKIEKYSDAALILVLGKKTREKIYDELKKSGRSVNKDSFNYALAWYAFKLGGNIDQIKLKKEGVFEVDIKGKQPKDIEDVSEQSIKDVLYKPEKKMEMSANPSIQSSSSSNSTKAVGNFTTSKGVRKTDGNLKPQVEEVSEEQHNLEEKKTVNVNEIKKKIKEKVIGQDKAIDDIVNNIYINQRYIDSGRNDLVMQKANIIMDGPTGTGKTFILKEVAENLNLPINITSAIGYSSVGYKGADLSDILYKLIQQSNGDLELAERGIVAFDEIDKLGRSNKENGLEMHKSIQHELLTFISGTKYDVEYEGRSYEFDTSKLTVIGMGAFTDLRERKIAENEKKYKTSIGFSSGKENDIDRTYTINKDDYISEGMERELVGRFSCLTCTNELGLNEMKEILTTSKTSPLKVLQSTGEILGCKIDVPDEMIEEIAKMGLKTNTGARGLNQIVQGIKDVITNDMLSGRESITITPEILEQTKKVHTRAYNPKLVEEDRRNDGI